MSSEPSSSAPSVPTSSSQSLIQKWTFNPEFLPCPMYHVCHARFPPNNWPELGTNERCYLAMGTGGLSGCTIVIVSYPGGAVMAHIPPHPDLNFRPANTKAELCSQMMAELVAEVKKVDFKGRQNHMKVHIILSPSPTNPFAEGHPEHWPIIEDALTAINIPPSPYEFYYTSRDRKLAKPESGTVVVEGQGGDEKPLVYLEDRLIS